MNVDCTCTKVSSVTYLLSKTSKWLIRKWWEILVTYLLTLSCWLKITLKIIISNFKEEILWSPVAWFMPNDCMPKVSMPKDIMPNSSMPKRDYAKKQYAKRGYAKWQYAKRGLCQKAVCQMTACQKTLCQKTVCQMTLCHFTAQPSFCPSVVCQKNLTEIMNTRIPSFSTSDIMYK